MVSGSIVRGEYAPKSRKTSEHKKGVEVSHESRSCSNWWTSDSFSRHHVRMLSPFLIHHRYSAGWTLIEMHIMGHFFGDPL